MLKEKYPTSAIDDYRYQNKGGQEGEELVRQEPESFGCLYCDKLKSTTDEKLYLNHVVNHHYNKSAHPSKADLEKNNLKPQGKKWEI